MGPTPAQRDLQVAMKRIAAIADPERYRRLDKLEQIWKGRRYEAEGRPSFWNGDVPLRERAPCIAYPLARSAGQRLVSLVFGEGRFPHFTVGNGGSEMTGIQLTPDDAKLLTQAVSNVIAASKLKLRAREGLEAGLMCGSAAFVVAIRAGRLRVDLIPAKWCTPTFHPQEDGRVTSLEVRYRYKSKNAKNEPIDVWYRRVISETEDREWKSVLVDLNGYEPLWDQEASKGFALEFCPVTWVKNSGSTGAIGDFDGVALHEGLDDEHEALDFALSQRHRSGQYNGDPQMLLTGASRADLEASDGRAANEPNPLKGWMSTVLGRDNKDLGPGGGASNNGRAIKKSPGEVWALSKEGGEGKLLETTGKGAEVLAADARELRAMITEVMGVVMLDSSLMAHGDVSAAALKLAHAPTLALADNLRETWGDALVSVVGQLLRLCTTQAARDAGGRCGVYGVANADALVALLSRFNRPLGAGTTSAWFNPPFELEWGEYFESSWVERLAAAQAAQTMKGTLSDRTIIQAVAHSWGVADVEGEMASLTPAPSLVNTIGQPPVSTVVNPNSPQPAGTVAPVATPAIAANPFTK